MDEEGVEFARAQLSAGQPLIAIASAEHEGEGLDGGGQGEVPGKAGAGPRLRPVGVAARIVQVVKDRDGETAVVVEGLARVRIGAIVATEPQLVAEGVAGAPARPPYAPEGEGLALQMKKLAGEIPSMIEGKPRHVLQGRPAV